MPAWSRRSLHRAVAAAALSIALPASAGAATFEEWLVDFKRDAQAQGISAATLTRAFKGVRPIDRIIELDRRQPEGRMTFAEYRTRVLNDQRVRRGQELLRRHRQVLEQVRARFGVPPQVVVALWGIESSYGEFKGKFGVVEALATLAFDGRRAELFRRELIAALKILDRGDVAADAMFGSWAGAMGQCQFMPSTYLNFAVDLDNDGRRDIWRSLPDVFGSTANYLAKSGWQATEIWGREIRATAGVEEGTLGLDKRADLAVWQRRGIRRVDGGTLPATAIEASLVMPDGTSGPGFLVYRNFRTIMTWNRSTYFALTVGLLADELASAAS